MHTSVVNQPFIALKSRPIEKANDYGFYIVNTARITFSNMLPNAWGNKSIITWVRQSYLWIKAVFGLFILYSTFNLGIGTRYIPISRYYPAHVCISVFHNYLAPIILSSFKNTNYFCIFFSVNKSYKKKEIKPRNIYASKSLFKRKFTCLVLFFFSKLSIYI